MRVDRGSLNGTFWTQGARIFRRLTDFSCTLSALSTLEKL
jgi:hypothetical protein